MQGCNAEVVDQMLTLQKRRKGGQRKTGEVYRRKFAMRIVERGKGQGKEVKTHNSMGYHKTCGSRGQRDSRKKQQGEGKEKSRYRARGEMEDLVTEVPLEFLLARPEFRCRMGTMVRKEFYN